MQSKTRGEIHKYRGMSDIHDRTFYVFHRKHSLGIKLNSEPSSLIFIDELCCLRRKFQLIQEVNIISAGKG